jgi:hypothetical protein
MIRYEYLKYELGLTKATVPKKWILPQPVTERLVFIPKADAII